MKKLFLYFIIFLCAYNKPINGSIEDSIISTSIPLLKPYNHKQEDIHKNIATFVKKYALVLTGCFYYTIQQGQLAADIEEHPLLIGACIGFIISNYDFFFPKEKIKKNEDIIIMMQELFDLLIIGHGIYNKICFDNHQKNSTIITQFCALTRLRNFLYQAHNSWIHLFSYHQTYCHENKPIYQYKMNQIDYFEVCLVTSNNQEIFSLITEFYQTKNNLYNYEPIIDYLELNLEIIHQKMVATIPGYS